MKRTFLFVLLFSILPSTLWAQSSSMSLAKKEDDHYGYFLINLGFSEFKQYKFQYELESAGFIVQIHFKDKHHGFMSGYSFNYKKSPFENVDLGHFVGFNLFTRFDGPTGYIRFGPGIEYGLPDTSFDKTRYNRDKKGKIASIEHLSVKRNFVSPAEFRKRGTLYPFVEGTIGQKGKYLIFEFGVRIDFLHFKYEFDNLVSQTYGTESRWVPVPRFFVSFGPALR